MAVEVTAGGTSITGEHIEIYRVQAIASALAIEVSTGMKNRANVKALANQLSGSKARTKLAALRDYATWLESQGLTVLPSVERALRAGGPPR